MKKKGQASIEMLTTVGIMLVFIVPMALLLLTVSNSSLEEVSKSQSDVSVKKIANALNNVYIGGEGTTKTILVILPSNSKSLNITGIKDGGGEVMVVLTTNSGVFEASYPFISTLEEDFHTNLKGLFWLKIENVGGGEINISS